MLLPAELADVAPPVLEPPPRLIPPPPLPPPKPPELWFPPTPPPPLEPKLEPPKLLLLDIPPMPPELPIPPKPPPMPLAASLKLDRPSEPLPVVGERVDGPLPPLSRLLSTWTISSACAFLSR